MSVRFRRLAASVAAVVALGSMLTLPATGASAGVPRPSSTAAARGLYTGYAVNEPVCAAPTRPGQFTCMAYRKVNVPAGTRGAQKYTIPLWARGPAGGYTPQALASAYYYDPKFPTAMTVAIVDWNNAPNIRHDLAIFDKHYHLPAETASSFRVVNEWGNSAPLPASERSASVEISLDVETVRAVCNHCRILLVEAAKAESPNLARAENTAVRMGAKVVSNSFGAPETRGHAFPASVYRAFIHKGVVITASSGDDGWYDWDVANDDPVGYAGYAPQTASFPSSLSSVVSVGGTRLSLTSDGRRAAETVWNNNGTNDAAGLAHGSQGASGGGCSTQFTAAGWQTGLPGYRGAGCGDKRLSVDVSADADPATGFDVLDTYGIRGWATIGGTSLAAPLVAGMWALAGAAQGMAYPVRALYQNYRFRPGSIYDVTAGGNAWCAGTATAACAQAAEDFYGTNNPNDIYGAFVDCSFPKLGTVKQVPARSSACNAAPGYDGPTGVGTPRNLRIFRSTAPTLQITAAPHSAGQPTRFWMHITQPLDNARIVRREFRFSDATGAHTTTWNTITHVFTHPGAYAVQATITDNVGQTATATTVVRIP